MASFPETLVSLRAKAELSQAALCTKAGNFSQPLLSRYESGKATPSAKTALRLANALGVEVAELRLPEKAAVKSNGHATKVSVRKRRPKAQAPVILPAEMRGVVMNGDVTVTTRGVTITGPRDAVLAVVTLLV